MTMIEGREPAKLYPKSSPAPGAKLVVHEGNVYVPSGFCVMLHVDVGWALKVNRKVVTVCDDVFLMDAFTVPPPCQEEPVVCVIDKAHP